MTGGGKGLVGAAKAEPHMKRLSAKQPDSSVLNGRKECVCDCLCEPGVGQLSLLALFTPAACWLHGTVTPCPPFSSSHKLRNSP